MAVIEKWFNQDLDTPVQIQVIQGNVFSQDNYGNLIGIRCYKNGQAAALTGSVSGVVIRPDGETVAIIGTLNGNAASVTLPFAACAIPGLITVTIKLTTGSTVTTLGCVIATVYKSSTDTIVDPGTIIPSVSALIEQIEDTVATIPADYSNLWEDLAPAFSTSASYLPGQYVTYNGALYKFNTEHSGAWDASDADEANIGDNLYRTERALTTPEMSVSYVLKGWQNGTGFVDSDSTMTPGVVLKSDENDVIVSTDFSKYVASIYFFNSAGNLYPTWMGNMTAPYTIPKGQYFTYFIRYKTGVSTLDQADIDYIPLATSCRQAIGVWNQIAYLNNAIETNEVDCPLVLKGWENGTGFVASDSVVSPGVVMKRDECNVTIRTDFTKFVASVYFFTSPTNLYPRWMGNMTEPYTIPKGQYYTFTIRYKTGASTLSDEDVAYIHECTRVTDDVGVWNAIEDLKTAQADRSLEAGTISPYVSTFSDYPLPAQIQGGVIVGDNLYQFTGAGEYIGDYLGQIYKIDLQTKEITQNGYHDLGHAACVSYIPDKDALICGRVIGTTPILQIYNGFSEAMQEAATLKPDDDNCISIQLDEAILNGRTSFDGVVFENNITVFAYCTRISSYNNEVLLYKILLGTGTHDFSQDEMGYGTYKSGTADGDYNGTCKIIGQWYLPPVDRQPQMITWENGSLYMLTGVHDAVVYKYKFVSDKFFVDSIATIAELDADGTMVSMEPESMNYYGGKCFVGMWSNGSPTKMRLLQVLM